jgi:hypothetical protein
VTPVKPDFGAVLLQEDQPIAYASRALTETETRYTQIEKELLAIVWATYKFDQNKPTKNLNLINISLVARLYTLNQTINH